MLLFHPRDAGPPTQHITPDDHGAYLTIVAAILMTWMLLCLAMRILIRMRFNGPWGHDDTAVSLGSFFAVVQVALALAAVHNGLGTRQSLLGPERLTTVQKLQYSSQLVYIAAVAASKCSTSLLVARLSNQKRHLVASHGVTLVAVIWALVSILVLALKCRLSTPWEFGAASCSDVWTRWLAVEICSILIEVALFGLSIFLIWDLRMSRLLKAIVVCAFSCRILVIVTIVVRLVYLKTSLASTDDYTFNLVYPAILLQVCMHYSLMAATLPCTKPFIKAFHSGFTYGSTPGSEPSRFAPNTITFHPRLSEAKSGTENVPGSSYSKLEKCHTRTSQYEASLFRPDVVEVTTVVDHDDSPDPTVVDEGMSIHGVGPEDLVIHQKRDCEVIHERVDV